MLKLIKYLTLPVTYFSSRMASVNEVKALLKAADAVCFDVDSTVVQEEGIDELAKFCGKGEKVAELTKKAMQGSMSFQQSLSTRLNIIQPSLSQIQEFLRAHPLRLTPGIEALIDVLQSQKKEVFLISGGFRCLIAPIATRLNIPPENIHANKLKFFFTGEYAGFDENQPTCRTGGKSEVIRQLKESKNLNVIIHIGDGATDLEAAPPASTFIGFGGNVIREEVKARAPWFITDFDELIKVLQG